MQRTLYAHEIIVINSKIKNKVDIEDVYGDFNKIIGKVTSMKKTKKKVDYSKDKKVIYIDKMIAEENKIIMVFKSARYASGRNVVNTITMEDRGVLKAPKDGDEETTHLILSFNEDGKIVCLIEYNKNGVGLSKILNYFNDFIRDYHKQKKDNVLYRFESKNILSHDFLAALKRVKKIKIVTLTVEQENVKVSDYKRFAGKSDISKDIDILLRPASSVGILGNTVKDLFELYEDDDKIVKRITVDAEAYQDEKLKFDTEALKEKVVVEVDENFLTGVAKSEDVIKALKDNINMY